MGPTGAGKSALALRLAQAVSLGHGAGFHLTHADAALGARDYTADAAVIRRADIRAE